MFGQPGRDDRLGHGENCVLIQTRAGVVDTALELIPADASDVGQMFNFARVGGPTSGS
jgi:hypothetical protein